MSDKGIVDGVQAYWPESAGSVAFATKRSCTLPRARTARLSPALRRRPSYRTRPLEKRCER